MNILSYQSLCFHFILLFVYCNITVHNNSSVYLCSPLMYPKFHQFNSRVLSASLSLTKALYSLIHFYVLLFWTMLSYRQWHIMLHHSCWFEEHTSCVHLQEKWCCSILLNNWFWDIKKLAVHPFAQLVERASHVQRPCPYLSVPGFQSRPGSLCCVSLPLFVTLFSVISEAVLSLSHTEAKNNNNKTKNGWKKIELQLCWLWPKCSRHFVSGYTF